MKGEKKKKKKKGKAFTFYHCYKELKDEEKWKIRETFDASKKKSVVTEDEEDVAGEERRSPTPHSAMKSYRPDGNKKVKGAKAGDNDLKEGFDAIVTARKEYAEEKRMLKLKEIKERSEAKWRRAVAKEKRAAAEERLAAVEERKVDLEEEKAAAEEMKMVEEKALKFMFMDTSTLDPKAKAYVELRRDKILMKKQMLMRQMMMGGGMGGGMGSAMGGGTRGAMNGAFGGNTGGGFGGNKEGGFGGMGGGFGGNMAGMGGGFGGNMMGGFGAGYGGNMSGVGGGFLGNMTSMGGNEGASGGAPDNEISPLHNVDKEAGDDDDCTTVHNAGGVDDMHE
nr:keratin, type I cytoskeletal 10-like [Aegilops tauschii subsp. strangulata]